MDPTGFSKMQGALLCCAVVPPALLNWSISFLLPHHTLLILTMFPISTFIKLFVLSVFFDRLPRSLNFVFSPSS
jgi:hypothetical protein